MKQNSAAPDSLLGYFGRHLRRLRQAAGMTQEQLGREIGYSAQLVGNVEQGTRMPSEDFCEKADKVLDAGGMLADLAGPMRRQATGDEHSADFVTAEARAAEIYVYESHLVPGLLQTEAYARAIIGATRPPLPPDAVDARVALRLGRQELFSRDEPPRVWMIIDEAVLYRRVGSEQSMREQLARLVESTRGHLMTLQVLPFASATTPAMGTSYNLLTFESGPPMVFLDMLAGNQSHRDPAAISRHRVVYDHLREAALPEAESAKLIEARYRELD